MSVQLILYPQNYSGYFNALSSSPTEVVVNGINFADLDNTVTYTSAAANPYTDSLTNSAPSIVNTWYRFRKGTSAYPTVVLGNLTLETGSGDISGIYQQLSNLTIGAQYTITINIDTAVVGGNVKVGVYSGTTLQTSTTYNSNVTQITKTFNATATELTIMVSYSNATATDLVITDISTQPVIGAVPSGSASILDNGQVICDLYEDEDIPLSLSVDDFKNVAEQVQSYSKAFNLPATKRNNRIFDQIFEITRSDDGVIFNPYKKSQCVLKQDGFILFEGYIRLLDVTDKEGEISYNVNLYSEVVALADVLKDRQFSDLDFTELEHDYTVTQVQLSWNDAGGGSGMTYTNPSTSGFRQTYGTVRYPFVNWNNQYTIHPTSVNLPNLESTFRPFINVKYLIDRIFNAPDTPFSYTSDFFNAADFEKMYMDFNWGSDNTPFTINNSGEGYVETNQTATTSFVTIQTNDNNFQNNLGYSLGVYTALLDNQSYTFNYSYAFSVTGAGAWTGQFRWKMVKGGVTSYINTTPVSGTGTSTYMFSLGNLAEILNTGDTLTPQFKSASAGTHTFEILALGALFGTIGQTTAITSATAATNNRFLQTLRGELGQWDFLKGLMTMFNLVALADPDNPNIIKIEPYADVFINSADSVQLDWTDKIDVSEMKLTPLADLNKKTIFKFVEDDDDFAFTNYKNLVGGHLYGSKKYDAGNEFNILQGEDEIVAEPFAATVIKPLKSQYPQLITPALYSYNPSDNTSEGFDNSPRIMYNNEIKATGIDCYVPAQNGSGAVYLTNFLQFSHFSDIPTVTGSLDFHFGECQLLVGASTPNNLFNTYWLPYYSELYNPNTRTMTIKVNLTPADINTFKFNDTVFLKNRVFRVNKIDYKPNDLATVEFILIP